MDGRSVVHNLPGPGLVLIGFAGAAGSPGPQQIQVTMRVDLAEAFEAQVLQPLTDALLRADSAAVAAVLLTDSVGGDPRQIAGLLACRDALAAAMDEVGLDVLDVLVATESRWWSLCCEQLECCPAAGHQRVLGCSAAAAQATFAGLVALPDRDAMAATLAGRSGEQRSGLSPLLAEAERAAGASPEQALGRRRTEIMELLAAARRLAAGPARLTDAQLARYAVALTDLGTRDALFSQENRTRIDDGSIEATGLLNELHRGLPAPYDAAPLFLYGWAQWRAGNGTLAMMAAERALASEPGYSAAVLLLTAVQRGLDPRSVPALRQPESA